MATPITIRGKEKLLKQFNTQKNPFWRILSANKSVVFSNTSESNFKNSFETLREILENLGSDQVYYLQIFELKDKKFTHPFADISFCLDEEENFTTPKQTKKEEVNTIGAAGNIRNEIELIRQVAILTAEKNLLEIRLKEQTDKNEILIKEIKELEAELDEIEEEEEEEEKQAVGNPLTTALASLITENGGMILENIMSKGVSGAPKEEIQEPEDKAQISGVEAPTIPLLDVLKELGQRDPDLHNHLYKLLLIARQKPQTFKYFLKQLEKF